MIVHDDTYAWPLLPQWGTDYDWRKVEARLNALPMFTTKIDGIEIQFIQVKSHNPNALPIIITHGWPGSIIELLGVIDPLTNPTAHGGRTEDAFDVIIPSMPGYGFSGKPAGTGWDPEHIARDWGELMKRLGYTRYVAQGGDWGLHHRSNGASDAGGLGGHPRQLAGDHTARNRRGTRQRRSGTGGAFRQGTRGLRCARRLQQQSQSLFRDDADAAANDRLLADGLTPWGWRPSSMTTTTASPSAF